MLVKIRPGPIRLDETGLRPPIVEPLITAAARGEDVMPVVVDLTRKYGYTHFMYGVSFKVPPDAESRQFFFSTLEDETFMRQYIAKDYIEVDPRVRHVLASHMPLIWQQSMFWNESQRMNEFLTDAERVGVGSGVCFGMYSGRVGCNSMFTFSAAERAPSAERMQEMQRHVGDLMVWGAYFNDAIMSTAVEAAMAQEKALASAVHPSAVQLGLSPKQLACLQAAAEGLKGEQIAARIGCSLRSVQVHWSAIRTRLGARSREEAVARAVKLGLVNLGN